MNKEQNKHRIVNIYYLMARYTKFQKQNYYLLVVLATRTEACEYRVTAESY